MRKYRHAYICSLSNGTFCHAAAGQVPTITGDLFSNEMQWQGYLHPVGWYENIDIHQPVLPAGVENGNHFHKHDGRDVLLTVYYNLSNRQRQ